MTMFNAANANGNMIIQQVQAILAQIRDAMAAAEYLSDFQNAVALGDLTAAPPNGPGMDSTTAQDLLSACADAYGHSLLYQTGTDPRNPGAGYVYGASQKIVLSTKIR